MRNANTCVRACFHALTNAHAHAHAHAHARVRTRNKGRSAIVQHHFYPLLATRTCEQARTHANTRTQTHKCMQCTARAHAHKTNTSRGVFPDERRRLGHRRGYTYQNLNIHHVLAHQPADPPSTFRTACQGKSTARQQRQGCHVHRGVQARAKFAMDTDVGPVHQPCRGGGCVGQEAVMRREEAAAASSETVERGGGPVQRRRTKTTAPRGPGLRARLDTPPNRLNCSHLRALPPHPQLCHTLQARACPSHSQRPPDRPCLACSHLHRAGW